VKKLVLESSSISSDKKPLKKILSVDLKIVKQQMLYTTSSRAFCSVKSRVCTLAEGLHSLGQL